MKKLLKVFLFLMLSLCGLFAVTFVIYFFNLDMKLTSKIEPLLIKHYDNMPRNQRL